MRAAKISKVKRRLLQEAITENLDTIRGLPPRAIRAGARRAHLWTRRLPLLFLFVALAGSTYLASNPTPVRDTIAPARIIMQHPRRVHSSTSPIDPTPVSAAVFPLTVRRVVIDAGHGGNDPGTSSPLHFTEKEVTLDVAQRLSALLRLHGFDVVATRGDDHLIPLRERARIANDSQSDIFVSIHVNSIAKHTSEHGVETYYLGPTNDPTLTRLVADENRMSGYSVSDLRHLLDGIYADARRDESQRLAAEIQQRLFSKLQPADAGLANWGVKRAPFIVLVATEMPAVLAEIGCMSNEHEVAMMRRAEYRQQIAQALCEGIEAYASAADAPQKKGST